MVSAYGQKSGVKSEELHSLKSAAILHVEDFVLPWGSRAEISAKKKRATLIEFAVYAVVVAAAVYSAAVSSLPVLLAAMVVLTSYVILSHSHEKTVESCREIEDENYKALVSANFGRN